MVGIDGDVQVAVAEVPDDEDREAPVMGRQPALERRQILRQLVERRG